MAKKTLGLILELNPFHNGHKYFIEKAKEIVNPDTTIAIITSSFSMRGDIMVMDKFSKTNLLLDNGIDLVLELPFVLGTCSSDYFSYNAISILNSFNITHLAFGIEADNIDALVFLKNLTILDSYNITVKKYLDGGNSYTLATTKAIEEITGTNKYLNDFNLPNNTLAISYLKAIDMINPNINYIPVKRINNNYYDEEINSSLVQSASAIRKLIEDNRDYKDYVIDSSYSYIDVAKAKDNIFFLLKSIFTLNDISYFNGILGVSEGIENRINSFINNKNSLDELTSAVQTKRYTINKIKRVLLNILFNVRKETNDVNAYPKYLRVLGFNNNGHDHISSLDKETKKIIITTLKNKDDYISNLEKKVTMMYDLITNKNTIKNEYLIPIKKESE